MEAQSIRFDQIDWQSPQRGLRFKAFRSGKTQIRLVEFSHGFIERDWCHNGHIGYVLSGELDVEFSGRKVRFSEGSAILIPDGLEHAHKAQPVTPVVKLFLIEEVST
jgi:quercetin dioxygenase-like cupin family protein